MINGKVVIVTGGSSGIGFDIVKKYLKNEWYVLVLARKKYSYFSLNKKFHFLKGDVSNENSHKNIVKLALKLYGRIDCYINCAGVSEWKSIDKVNTRFWNKIIGTNLLGTMWGCKIASKNLKKGGSIINISSIAGKRGSTNNSIYCASKFGVNGLTQSLSKELGSRNIRVNALCPVYIKTPGLKKALKDVISPTKGKNINNYLEDFSTVNSAIKQLPSGEDVANLCFYLSSINAKVITGQCINIDSGVLPQ